MLQVSKNKKIVDAELIKLPGSTKNDNISKSITKVKLGEDLATIAVERENSYSGHYKPSEQSNKLYFFDYVYEDYKKYNTETLLERVSNKKKREQYQKEFDAFPELGSRQQELNAREVPRCPQMS
ncbi:MAG: hypothetical protein J0M25_12025 [Flavobacteriales bacterium]|nr:hypothetical protein [Flavobacteriales bacterium]